MPIRLDARDADFAERFRAFLATKREASADVEAVVRAIIAEVVARGDQALAEFTRQFDRVDLSEVGLKVTSAEIEMAAATDRNFKFTALVVRFRSSPAFAARMMRTSESEDH